MEKVKTDALAEENIGLVHLCANRFRGRGIEYDDLYGAGCIGLMKACRGFDSERGVKFSTYAVPVILGEIRRLFRDGGAIKVSRGLKENALRIGKIRDDFCASQGREPTLEELAKLSGVEVSEVVEALNVSFPPISLTCSEDEKGGQFDIPTPSPDEEITNELSVRQLLMRLEPKDRKLIYLRYFKNLTQVQTAEVLGMKKVQVSRREKKLLGIMRKMLEEF